MDSSFKQVREKHFKDLELYVTVVAKVHGASHPEFLEVKKLYDDLNKKISDAKDERPQLKELFAELKKITKDYKVPEDTCETYEAVYMMLSEMDDAYNNESK